MQIIIDLYQDDEGCIHVGDHQLEKFNCFELAEFLDKLKRCGYHINSLFGSLIYDCCKDEVIDCGEAGPNLPSDNTFAIASALYQGNGKLLIVFVDKRYCLFTDRYFAAIYFCHLREVKPISPHQANDNFKSLIIKKDKVALDKLYRDSFLHSHKDGKVVPTLFNPDGSVQPRRSEGFGVPAPMPRKGGGK